MLKPESYACGQWIAPGADAQTIIGPVSAQPIAQAGGAALDFGAMLDWARAHGGPALRAMTFHQRAKMLKALAGYLDARKEELYAINPLTGATRRDGWVDIDGGIGTMFLFAAKGRREMPDGHVYIDGEVEQLGRKGGFLGQHIAVPLQGAAVHINAFNFPVWGMLEKLAPALLAGVPCIVKPATQTCYLTEACFRMIIGSGLLPDGAVQLVIGRTGDLLDRLGAQDAVAFTGSADTALLLRGNQNLLRHSVRFTSEQDSLNAAILGPDADVGGPEFDLFVTEAVTEITTKAGQKCTAMRRLIVPQTRLDDVAQALSARLAEVTVGDPADTAMRMGALASHAARDDVLDRLARLKAEARVLCGDTAPDLPGAFLNPTLLACDDPDAASAVHEIEAFGPVATLLPYRDTAHAAQLANAGGGSLVASLFTNDAGVARDVTLASAAHHGRLYIMNRAAAPEAPRGPRYQASRKRHIRLTQGRS